MCGIAGFVDKSSRADAIERAAVLDRMCKVIRHRGPDDQGVHLGPSVALGMRRLSIIDVAGGHQPISGEDRAVTVVFNGEIYNYRELKKELVQRGHRFQTDSDTETIVHAFEEYGTSCVNHLRGMFAFAIWDERYQSLFIARDRVGKKPLYYTVTASGSLIFGSEIKSLLQHPEVTRETDPRALDAYLSFGYVPDPLTIFRGINKLPPGHYLTFENGQIKVQEYWDINYAPVKSLRAEDYVGELRALLDESVRIRLMSEVPLGAFLSGGIDSSIVVGLMARHMGQPVKTFSIGFREDSYNELKYARIAAKHFGTDHHEFIVTPDICQIIDDLVTHFDEPFADSSSIPTYMVSKLARKYVTVALSGDGGDELFAGYTRYIVDRQRSSFTRLPRFVRQGMVESLSRRLPHGAWGRNYLHNVSLDAVDRYIDSISVFTTLNKRLLYTPEFAREVGGGDAPLDQFRNYAFRINTGDELDRLLYLDSKTYLPGDILVKVDRMSMAASLEARAPLLDHKLIEFVARIPASLKMNGLNAKLILKQATSDILPPEIVNRPKQGFGLPLQRWINEQLRERVHETLTEQRTVQRGYFDPEYINKLLSEHKRGRRDHSNALWTLMMFELWHRTYLDGFRDAKERPDSEWSANTPSLALK